MIKLYKHSNDMPGNGPAAPGERRVLQRRQNKKLARVVYNAHALSRVFGAQRAQTVLQRAGFSLPEAQEILRDKKDRRQRVNRKQRALP